MKSLGPRVQLNVRVEPEFRDLLNAEAEEVGLKIGAYVRQVLLARNNGSVSAQTRERQLRAGLRDQDKVLETLASGEFVTPERATEIWAEVDREQRVDEAQFTTLVAKPGPTPPPLPPAPSIPPVSPKLDPLCFNAALHWRISSGQRCRFCGGQP